jgi:hypothetical protein
MKVEKSTQWWEMEGSKRKEGFFIFCVAVSVFSCLCPGTHDTQVGRSNSLVRTLLYTRSGIMDSVCSNTKNFVVILIVISLGTLDLHHHIIWVYFENKCCQHNSRPQPPSFVRSHILSETPVCALWLKMKVFVPVAGCTECAPPRLLYKG